MDDLYRVKTQKTYKGKAAGGWLKNATVAPCGADIVYVWVDLPDIGQCQVFLTYDGDMVIENFTGQVACLETSNRAYRRLKALEARAEKANSARFAW